jgi:hypothetical protein
VSFANGQVPASALSPLPGSNAGLLKMAALAYRAMDAATSVSLAIIDGPVGRTYRSIARQYLAKRIYGPNAAWPGTSNHGLAITVDLMSLLQRRVIDAIGRHFGWAKEWSDASWEWWHLKWREGVWKPRPDPLRFLGPRRRQAATTLLYRRRRRAREARSGKGPQWRKWNRLVSRSYQKVERLHRRASGDQKAVLARVLADRNGTL